LELPQENPDLVPPLPSPTHSNFSPVVLIPTH
jgi:hypothetical protein